MATTRVPFWELYSSDLNISKMMVKRELPPIQFDIPIISQHLKHKLGSGPPPPHVNLRLEHDTDAFIIDKIVLPLEPFTHRNDPRQRRVYYIIGWPDLLAARPVIDATKVLEYVSPRTLEDWEYQDALRREEAREAEDRATQNGRSVAVTTAGQKSGVKRKPGRPPRARMMDAPPPEPILDSDQEEELQRRKSGPSLSTPRKSRLAQLVAEEEILEHLEVADEEGSLSVVQRETGAEVPSGGDIDIDADVNLEESGGVNLLRSSSAASSSKMPLASISQPGSTSARKPDWASSISTAAAGAAATIRHSSLPASSRQHTIASTSLPLGRPQDPNIGPVSHSPIPLPPYISQLKKQTSSTTEAEPRAKPQLKRVVPSIEKGTPTGFGQSAYSSPHKIQFMGRRPSSSSHPSPSRGNGFTPIGGTFPRPPKRPADETPDFSDTPASTQSKERTKKKKKAELSQSAIGSRDDDIVPDATQPAVYLVQGEQDYVVKRLEGDYVLEGVHWFKVRWDGDWPSDQNPTWEPEENITPKLVQEYLKRKAKREAEKSSKNRTPGVKTSGTGTSKDKRQSSLAEWARGVNSVSEAFEGKAELEATPANDQAGDNYGEVGDGDDEPFIVDSDEVEDRERAAREMRKRLDAQFAALARRESRQF
ncbi:hypothetical protein VPNG_10027 [Cytospora leucostoma]|uniref:Chromo domain-containing protein n=1 Tax=Cytospora leucostoma TaxID=1230097 RepID=A0A423VHG2_9PEZI|nr:hypothetical protein VPNG_10027 [Cytospora leucostoma]